VIERIDKNNYKLKDPLGNMIQRAKNVSMMKPFRDRQTLLGSDFLITEEDQFISLKEIFI